jgi:tetratricopeptide (TPR) repeat protein
MNCSSWAGSPAMRSFPLLLALALPALGGCAAALSPAPVAAPPAQSAPVVEVPATVVSPFSDSELAAQFDAARRLLLDGDDARAAEAFDRLVRLAPDGQVAPPSLLNAGLAYQGLGDRAAAEQRYRELCKRFPENENARTALLRLEGIYAYLERWQDLAGVAEQVVARGGSDLTLLDVIGAHGADALALVEQGKLDPASREVDKARDLIEQNRLGEAGAPPLELATVSFALGEVRRLKSEKLTFTPVPANFGEVLEERCQGLLAAQAAYSDAMRSFDAHWSAMAGYRVGQLYQQLHRDLMRVPPPAKADTLKRKQLFEGAMRLRYRVLLEKGLKLMDATVRIGDRTGEDSTWIHRAEEAKHDIELGLQDEKEALAKLPFTEAELTAALESLKVKP